MRFIKVFEDFNSDKISNISELINKLNEFSIPFNNWGQGKSKDIEDLWSEIRDKECSLIVDENVLIRQVEFVGIKVFYKDKKDCLWYLKEDRQEFNDGRIRRRNMLASVSEKMKAGESSMVAGIRGIKEELGIETTVTQLKKIKDIQFNGSSLSYPGLKSKYKGHQFSCFLNDEQFNENGYVEIQRTKKTYFRWTKVQ